MKLTGKCRKMFNFIFDEARDTEANKKNYSMSPYTQLFCIPQNSCLINLSEKTIRRKKIKATKDDVNYLTDKGITWEKEYICTTFITGTSSI